MGRALYGVLLALGLTTLGFALGGTLAGAFLVPRDAGLAGGALVALWGMGGAGAGFVAGIVLARRLGKSTLPRVTLVVVLLAVASLALLGWRAVERREARPGARTDGASSDRR